ncbi:hypothetical protein FYK55_00835 [Roseiconus nitratireducens]|uniref:Uncharacterized protein n=1 Tax=Roseiconus nitratireducens TaxID=2605748 RepID=A0A5M6DKS9_9BACT|nr:hypothetical protein [Roseiconus nitratireducens]KAA5546996.1 hypothetical protein FYK55_00835 [Roseiconus nitratireducens]
MMSDDGESSRKTQPRGFRWSIGTALLWVAIAGLVANSIMMHRRTTLLQQKIDHQQREMSALRPLPPEEVASQFERSTTLGPITTSVKDVRYSPEKDAYRIEFGWTDATTGKQWFTDVELKSDGYGTYYGQIRNHPFIEPLGREEFYAVSVRTPSPLAE